jgi:hypothetical protein
MQSALSFLRTAVGVGTWAAPRLSGATFGLGPALAPPDSALIGRLFAVRELALAQALRHPDAQVQRAALHAGLVVDTVDAAASLIAAARGGRSTGLVGVGAGALLFVAIGALASRAEAAPAS